MPKFDIRGAEFIAESFRRLWAGVGLAAAVCQRKCQQTKALCAAAPAEKLAKRRRQIY